MTLFLGIILNSSAVTVTVFGSGGIKGKKVCPKPPQTLICVVITTVDGQDLNFGSEVMFDVYSQGGTILYSGIGTFEGYNPQGGVNIDYDPLVYIEE